MFHCLFCTICIKTGFGDEKTTLNRNIGPLCDDVNNKLLMFQLDFSRKRKAEDLSVIGVHNRPLSNFISKKKKSATIMCKKKNSFEVCLKFQINL